MKTILPLFFVTVLFALSKTVFAAGNVMPVDVNFVRADASGKGYVQFASPLIADADGLPACGTSYPNALAFDTNTPGGQAILSLVLSAKMSGKKVRAVGTGTCTVYTVIENWSFGYVQ